MLKKIIGLVLGISLLCGVAMASDANPGDKGVSYKDNTAYCMSVKIGGGERTETWMLREGSQADWDHVRLGVRYGVVAVYVQAKIDGLGWYHRAVMQLGWNFQDSGWRKVMDHSILKDVNAEIAFQYAYFNLDTRQFEARGLWFTEYPTKTKAYIEGMIYAMAKKDYDDGQMGR